MDFLFKVMLFFTIATVGMYSFNAIRIRELAVIAANKHCQKLDVQLLDQSVSLSRVRLVRHKQTQLVLEYRYGFEFTSTGDERYRGTITMHGKRLTDIHMQAHRLPDTPKTGAFEQNTASNHPEQ